jgi:hypothetical protein
MGKGTHICFHCGERNEPGGNDPVCRGDFEGRHDWFTFSRQTFEKKAKEGKDKVAVTYEFLRARIKSLNEFLVSIDARVYSITLNAYDFKSFSDTFEKSVGVKFPGGGCTLDGVTIWVNMDSIARTKATLEINPL